MTTDNKTLADVQPGGRVRLGDQAERARFEAWAEPRKHTLTRWGDSSGDVKPLFVSEVAGNYISPATQAAWEAWQHLSAQPSPGGQDALLREVSAQLESLDCGACIGSDAPMEDLHGRIAAHLAARQPVGEPVLQVVEGLGEHRPRLTRQLRELPPIGSLLYAAPPAQAVDLGQFRPPVEFFIAYTFPGTPSRAEGERLLALIDGKAVGNG